MNRVTPTAASTASTSTASAISVVIPYFRARGVICRALKSIERQTLQPMEVIIVDDYSNDGSLEWLYAYSSRLNLKVITCSENRGPATARNIGWEKAEGLYIAFLDADDAWHPEKLEIQYQWMKTYPSVVITGHSTQVVSSDCPPKDIKSPIYFKSVSRPQLMLKNKLPPQTLMLKRDIPLRFQNDKRYSEDYLFVCEALCRGFTCAASPSPMTYLYKEAYGASGLSSNLWQMEKGELAVYQYLLKAGCLTRVEQLFFSAYSVVKFLRRWFLVSLRNKA